MQNSENPSVIRSRQMLTDALFELMKTKKFKDITITELVQRADLVRKTFYRNFSSKEEIIDVYVEERFKEYCKRLGHMGNYSAYSFVKEYFELWMEHYGFLRIICENDMMLYILKKYNTYLPLIGQQFQNIKISSDAAYQYDIAFSAGGYWYLLCKWVERGAVETPGEMAEIFMKCQDCFCME